MKVEDVADALTTGRVAIVPTDTVYGLAAHPHLKGAVGTIFELKGRPEHKALPVLGASVESLQDLAVFDRRAAALARRYWPGPLTLVLPRRDSFISDLGGDDEETIAVRIPARPLTIELLHLAGPLAVTSANRSGESPCRSVEEALEVFPGLPALSDGAASGDPSSVLSLIAEPVVLREGAIAESELLAAARGEIRN